MLPSTSGLAEFFDHPLPSDGVVLDRGTDFGVLFGNSNHCDAEAWMEIASDLSFPEMEAHYAELNGGAANEPFITQRRAPTEAGRAFVYRIVRGAWGLVDPWFPDIRCT